MHPNYFALQARQRRAGPLICKTDPTIKNELKASLGYATKKAPVSPAAGTQPECFL